jgi:hypothetical protein
MIYAIHFLRQPREAKKDPGQKQSPEIQLLTLPVISFIFFKNMTSRQLWFERKYSQYVVI